MSKTSQSIGDTIELCGWTDLEGDGMADPTWSIATAENSTGYSGADGSAPSSEDPFAWHLLEATGLVGTASVYTDSQRGSSDQQRHRETFLRPGPNGVSTMFHATTPGHEGTCLEGL